MDYTIDLYEDPDRWSRWDVVEWGDHPDPLDPVQRRTGKIIHSVRGNDNYSRRLAQLWLDNYLREQTT